MRKPISQEKGAQDGWRAMQTYFRSLEKDRVSRLRVDSSGDIRIAGSIEVLFDKVRGLFDRLISAPAEKSDWQTKARDSVVSKLSADVKKLLPGLNGKETDQIRSVVSAVDESIKLSKSSSWQQVFVTELELLSFSKEEKSIAHAIHLLTDVRQIGDRVVEEKALAGIKGRNINLESITEEGRGSIRSAMQDAIASHLSSTFQLDTQHANTGAEAILFAIQNYRMSMAQAISLLCIPVVFQNTSSDQIPANRQSLIQTGLAKTIEQTLGTSEEQAKKFAGKLEPLMRNFSISWMHALDISLLANKLSRWLVSLRNDRLNKNGSLADQPVLDMRDMEKVYAVHQVMQENRCDLRHAQAIVGRRLRFLPEISKALPPGARPNIANGVRFSIESQISHRSSQFLRSQIMELNTYLEKTPWIEPNSNTAIPIASNYQLDAQRIMNVVLDNGKEKFVYTGSDFQALTTKIHDLCKTPEVMTAVCDLFNQTNLAPILNIIQKKEQCPENQEFLLLLPRGEKTDNANKETWYMARIDDEDNLFIRHIHLERFFGAIDMESDIVWPVNSQDEGGDVNAANASMFADFSYKFKLSDLREGKRLPEIDNCFYRLNMSLDWNKIDKMLATREMEST